ncbi:MAPEG family protein [Ferrimonas sediminicola]|uniref:MAPEG family protein n=1 Tax=Ferrimonas sediminicola TaxID=2569538 RepID=A0A4U1BGS1_9GAMM|nr:MAPEG family protein [Ferrimonas sediminicola]TKB50542.1 MAPEG family protein [Ferrimonas sediminicola]
MPEPTPLLGPVVALIAWSLMMWLWMYLTRVPAILEAGMKLDPQAPRGRQMDQLPARVRWKADNYNHLMEQPTLFYPLILCLAWLGEQGALVLALAWAYVLLRVIHSLVQALGNRVQLRFVVYVLSNIPLFALTVLVCIPLISGS